MTRYQATINRLEPEAWFEIRGEPSVTDPVLARLRLPVPAGANRAAASARQVRVLRLGPDRLVVRAPRALEAELITAIEAACIDLPVAQAVQASDMMVTFAIEGAGARDVLAQGMPLDLAPEGFPAGSATGTEAWGIGVIIERFATAPDRFLLSTDRSYAGYLELWLRTAAGEESALQPGVVQAPPPPVKIA